MFHKIAVIVGMGLVAVAGVNAGQIQLGQIVGGVNLGLTTTYMTSGVGSTGTSTLKNYDTNLFSASTNAGSPPTPFTGYSNTAGVASVAGSTMMDSGGVTFAMISQTGSNGNFWDLLSPVPAITIPVGVFGVKTVWMMMNDLYGANGANNTDLIFTFDNAANGSDAASLNTVTLDLMNGAEIRDGVNCTNSGTTCTSLNYANTLSSSTTMGTTLTGLGPATVSVNTRNIYSGIYDGGSGAPYAGTSGNLFLDDQGFGFGMAFANQYLVSIGVVNNSGAINVSRTAVSAVTLITASPEPSTVLLFLTGLGIIGVVGLKKNRLNQN
jgi:hypothetical protein